MPRSPHCPFAPPQVLELNSQKPLSRVRIWDGSTPWLVTGYEEVRTLFSDPTVSVDDGFRGVFSKYIFGGILDHHPRLRIGWFEGGIAWVPWALQDAEHLVASYRHMFNRPLEHDIRYYWDHHMSASFMVDPLGLQLIDQIWIDKVMWSSDYPHNESTFGYSEKSLAAVVNAVGPEAAAKIVSGNIKEFLGP
jgi:predicted TIM-barrel fold metal-dependent hydrolase